MYIYVCVCVCVYVCMCVPIFNIYVMVKCSIDALLESYINI